MATTTERFPLTLRIPHKLKQAMDVHVAEYNASRDLGSPIMTQTGFVMGCIAMVLRGIKETQTVIVTDDKQAAVKVNGKGKPRKVRK